MVNIRTNSIYHEHRQQAPVDGWGSKIMDFQMLYLRWAYVAERECHSSPPSKAKVCMIGVLHIVNVFDKLLHEFGGTQLASNFIVYWQHIIGGL